MTATNSNNFRFGLHYYPDTVHYREQDLQTWLPELKSLGVHWLTLIAPINRAIPEFFIRELLAANIQPVIHFPLPLNASAADLELSVLFYNYARWGLEHVVLFDKPNVQRSWPTAQWIQEDLVERFIDIFLPVAEIALQAGLKPIFPPLEPGGDYWDTAFLQSSMRSLSRRGKTHVIDEMGISAYAWTYNRPVDWGAGGPERWPDALPYFTPEGSQDQIGFRIFDWYQAITQAELGKIPPVFLLRTGSRVADFSGTQVDAAGIRQHAEQNLQLIELLNQPVSSKISPTAPSRHRLQIDESEPLDLSIDPIVCANFWLLTAEQTDPQVVDAWYQPDGKTLPIVNILKQLAISNAQPTGSSTNTAKTIPTTPLQDTHPIEHYLLLPLYAWGVADWDLEAIRPFVQQHHPTVGFSVYEARLAKKVTIFGGETNISRDTLTILQTTGCEIERMEQDGTLLAL